MFAARGARYKCTVGFLQRTGVNALHAAPRAPRRSHGCTVEEYFYFHRAALARCCAFDSSAAQSLRGSRLHQPPPCRPYAADGCQSSAAQIRSSNFYYSEVCPRKYLCLKIPLSQNTLAMLNPLNTTGAKRGPAIMSCASRSTQSANVC